MIVVGDLKLHDTEKPWMHVCTQVGVFGKQTSCYFQAVASNISLIDNLCYNGPRAGLNYNDGHGGNNHIEGNLVFNMVRETGTYQIYDLAIDTRCMFCSVFNLFFIYFI